MESGYLDTDDIEVAGEAVKALTMKDFRQPVSKPSDFLQRVPAPLRPVAQRITTPKPVVVKTKCVGCGKCAESCPQHTIEIRQRRAVIHYQNCIKCYCCHEMCPAKAMKIRRFTAFNL